MSVTAKPEPPKVIARNAQASHLYHLTQRLEAGIMLAGTEVKAIREGQVNLRDAYVNIRGGEAFLVGCHVGAYSHTGYSGHEPTRPRKLLLHREEIRKLESKLTLRGLTLIPTRLYLVRGRIKVELALGEGKKLHDKRAVKREKDVEREIRRTLKERR